MSCYPGNSYASLSGTSMATPHVTGAAALALSLYSEDPAMLEAVIDRTAQHLEDSSPYENRWVFGSGLLRADSLLEKIVSDTRFKRIFNSKRRC